MSSADGLSLIINPFQDSQESDTSWWTPQKAIELGVDYIELDVVGDGILLNAMVHYHGSYLEFFDQIALALGLLE